MTKVSRRSLLFICPIMPQRSGNGLAMRAALVLEGLARHFDVYLFVVPLSGGSLVPDFVQKLTVKVGVLDLGSSIESLAALISQIADPAERRLQQFSYPRPWASRFCSLAAAQQVISFLAGTSIDALHVMRLYLAPLAEQVLLTIKSPAPAALLDLDDDDVCVHERLAELRRSQGDLMLAEAERLEALKYADTAARVLDRFNFVFLSSKNDTDRLAALHPSARFETLPNGYVLDPHLPGAASSRVRGSNLVRLLFVANFTYLPNADAALQMIHSVMPLLCEHDANVHLDIVGPGGSDDMLGGLTRPGVKDRIAIHGRVENVGDWYARADIAVMPLRAGGGTRIKILEAFAYGVPVVSSHIGAEGLEAEPGTHLLCADTAADFASACMRLAADPALAADLAANARDLLLRNYTPERVHAKLDAIIDRLPFEG